MSTQSKYDAYWASILSELEKALELAYESSREVAIDISDIARYGYRKPKSWAGRVTLSSQGIENLSGGAHIKSLARVLFSSRALSKYDVAFTLKVTRDLKLTVRAHKPTPRCACSHLFTDFHWIDLQTTDPSQIPNKSGVYVLCTRKRGEDPQQVYEKTLQLLKQTRWKTLLDYAEKRLARLLAIQDCPVLYIGSTPQGKLRERFRDLAGRRHTAFLPALALLLHGWQLDYGYLTTQTGAQAKALEDELKKKYIAIHGKKPPLTELSLIHI